MIEQLMYLITGAVAGLCAGLLGVGGGIVIVPILTLFFAGFFPADLLMHMAIGTSLAIMIFTAASSAYAYHCRGLVLWPLFLRFTPGMVLGTIVGSIIAMFLSSHSLSIAFAIFLLIIAVRMFIDRNVHSERQLPGWIGLTIAAFLTGILSGFFGIGGGVLMVPFFVYCNVVMQKATGTSAICGLVLAVIGTASLTLTGLPAVSTATVPAGTTGFVYWPAVLSIAITSVIFAPMGTRIAVWLSPDVLRRLFALVLVFIALYLMIQNH
jgi:uncharacterized membrane protein YfcA